MLSKIVSIALSIFIGTMCCAQTFTPLVENISASFRGMSTVGKKIVWVSGSNGTVGFSKDEGKYLHWVNPTGYERFDFRDMYAFSVMEAVIVDAGFPAVILCTTNAGKTWEQVYENKHPDIFLDD